MQQTPESGVKRSLYIHILAGFLMLGGCSQTVYTGYENSKDAAPLLSRVVKFETQDAFFREPPTCITVLPVLYSGDRQFKFLVEEAVARYLSVKAERIIGPLERQKMERRLALDLEEVSDRQIFTKQLRCKHFAQPEIRHVETTYALVWAQRKLELGLQIHGYERKNLLWKASHLASRGDGGLPLSPFSLGSALFAAGREHQDKDTLPSMIDDSFRRMLIKLPDTRQY
jgi:hypothetical protein